MFKEQRLFTNLIKICRRNSSNIKEAAEFVGCDAEFTEKLYFIDPSDQEKVPIYRIMNRRGQILQSHHDYNIDRDLTTKMYKCMVTTSVMDKILYESQRQGRISFYMTSMGEEASQVGSSAGLQSDDLIYGQYREVGNGAFWYYSRALLWRGLPLEQIMNQCYGNKDDWGKGRQMPMHFGSRKHNIVTISSPLATQVSQAVGSAYACKLAKNGRCVIVYFGDGAASEADTHTSLNFAATLKCPVMFFCRNNGYAISTPVTQQYKSDGVASRAIGFGITTTRVDGNDIFAVHHAVTEARKYILKNNRPIFIEVFTYRCGDHSTSDDSSRYRSSEEIKLWKENDDPISRLKFFMQRNNWWNDDQDKKFRTSVREEVLKLFVKAEKCKKPEWQEMFRDVFHEMPDNLKLQMEYMENHLKEYGQHYPLKDFKSS